MTEPATPHTAATRSTALVPTTAGSASTDAAPPRDVLSAIAAQIGVETLERRHRGHLNLHHLDVSQLERALAAAYEAGRAAGPSR